MGEIVLHSVPASQKTALAEEMRPYLAELAAIEGTLPPAHYPYLPLYWTETGRYAYWIYCGGARAGFALVNRDVIHPDSLQSISEFHIAPEFRWRGIGTEAVRKVLLTAQGRWEIGILPGHDEGVTFWSKALASLSRTSVVRLDPGQAAPWPGTLFLVDI